MRILNKRFNLLIILFCTTVTTILGIIFLGLKGFSMDEMDTLFITANWQTMLHFITYTEGNMWLYYFIVYFWKFGGHSEFFIRLLSVFFASATIPIAYITAKKLFNKHIAAIATILLSFHIFLISNAQIARSYTMVLFFTTLSSLFFIQYVQKSKKKYLLITTLANVLAVYCHLYALFIVAAQILSLVFTQWKSKWKELLLNGVLFALLILPLFLAPSMQSGQIDWIAKPDIKNLIGTYLILADDYPVIGGIYLVLIAWFFISVFKNQIQCNCIKKQWNYGFLFLWIVFPIVTSFIFSLLIKPLYISAYFFVCLVPFTIFIAVCISKIKRIWLRIGLIICIILLSLIRLQGWYVGSKQSGLVIRNYNEDFKGTALYLATHTTSLDGIIFLPSSTQEKVNFYLAQEKYPLLAHEIFLQPNYLYQPSTIFTIDINKLAALSQPYARIWYVRETITDKRVDADNAIIIKHLVLHYHLSKVIKLDAMTINEYTR